MSRVYKIKTLTVFQNLNLDSSGRMDINFKILNILPDGEMIELMKAELKKMGWTGAGEKMVLERPEGVKIFINFNESRIEIDFSEIASNEMRLNVPEELLRGKLGMARGGREVEMSINELVNDSGMNPVKDMVQREQRRINKIVISEGIESRKIINDLLKKVYRQAVLKKASQLGNVTNMSENEEDGKMKIRMVIE